MEIYEEAKFKKHGTYQKQKKAHPPDTTLYSTRIGIKVCDITGLRGNYKCNRTGLRYYDKSVYEYIKKMNSEGIQKMKNKVGGNK